MAAATLYLLHQRLALLRVDAAGLTLACQAIELLMRRIVAV
jgi:hypothetical protein